MKTAPVPVPSPIPVPVRVPNMVLARKDEGRNGSFAFRNLLYSLCPKGNCFDPSNLDSTVSLFLQSMTYVVPGDNRMHVLRLFCRRGKSPQSQAHSRE